MIGTAGRPIHLPTPQPGTDQITHPSVAWAPEGWNGHPYWMAATPYDGSNAQWENPCVYVSDDGVGWSPIGNNPIAPTPQNGHNSDTTLTFDGDRLLCVWREVVDRKWETLRAASSMDGVTWVPRSPIYAGDGFADHLSPTLVRDGDQWVLFSVRHDPAGLNRIRRHVSASLEGPWVEEPCHGIGAMPHGREPWHLWVGIGQDGRWHAIVTDTKIGATGGAAQLLYSSSLDGRTWAEPTVCLPTLSDWHSSLYRACAVWRCGGLDVWYSASAPQWRIGVTRLNPPTGGTLSLGILASAAVAPAAPGGWTSLNLLNSWVDFGSAAFDTPGIITPEAAYLRGLIKDGTTTAGTVIADNMSAPSGTLVAPCTIAGSPYALGQIDVNSSGELVSRSVSATGTYLPGGKYLPSTISPTAPTLSNSWVNYGGAFEGAGYYKDADGTVYLQGLIKDGTATAGTVLFTLPSGYRPSRRLVFPVVSNGAIGRVDVYANGEVQIISGSNTWLSLTGISFATASATAPTLTNSWVNYGGGTFADAGYYKDSDGVVHLTGLIKSGSVTTNTVITTLPAGYRPSNNVMHPLLSSAGFACAYIESDGELKVGVASNTWTSLDGFSFSTTA